MEHKGPSLRERFLEAAIGGSVLYRESLALEQGGKEGLEQFYKRFDDIAETLKDRLMDFVIRVEDGTLPMNGPFDVARYRVEPIHFEIPLPAALSCEQRNAIHNNLFAIEGYRKIHEICAGQDIDMAIITAQHAGIRRRQDNSRFSFDSVALEISPGRPYDDEDRQKLAAFKPSLPPQPPTSPPSALKP